MNHLSFTHITYLFGVVIVLSLIASVPCIAQNGTTLSGTVVDTGGNRLLDLPSVFYKVLSYP